MSKLIEVGVYTRFIVIANVPTVHYHVMREFIHNYLTTFTFDPKGGRVADKCYATGSKDGKIWRMPVSVLGRFKHWLYNKNIKYNLSYAKSYTPDAIKNVNVSKFEPRDSQPKVIDYLTSTNFPNKLVTLQTGQGKTFCTFMSILEWDLRTLISIPAKYLERWTEDIPKTLKIVGSKRELLVVTSRTQLNNLVDYAKTKPYKSTKIIVITSGVLFNFVKAFKEESSERSSYRCTPWELMEILSIGVKVVDEVHENFWQNAIVDLWLDYPISINLSATMESSNPDLNRMYEAFFPMETRCPKIPYVKYIKVYDWRYYLKHGTKVNSKQRGMGTYSHVEFEKSVMKKPKLLKNYFDIIASAYNEKYFDIRRDGERLLILTSTKQFARLLQEDFLKRHPNEDVGLYLQEHDYSVLLKHQIVISTRQSAGTAVDIPKLRTAILTTNLNSRQSNEQALGRTRDFKEEGIHPFFIFLICDDIEKHREYADKKHEFFEDKTYSIKKIFTGLEL